MTERITQYLKKLEVDKGIEILLACETGSRAWGFPSPDSDFDVRIIYKHHKDWYLSLTEEKDSIECFFEDNEIDISGWDIRKCLRLLMKSNPPLLEHIQSPIIYKVDKSFLNEFTTLAIQNYSRIATIHHYLGLAKKSYADVDGQKEYKLKKLFYALRASVACQWILDKIEIPPIEFKIMVENLDIPLNIKKRISELIDLKSTKSESYLHQGDQELLIFIESSIERAIKESQNLGSSKGELAALNNFFRKMVDV